MLSRLKNLIWDKVVAWLIAIPEANKTLYAINNHKRLLSELKPADVILFEGRTRVGDIIKLITLSPWIHSALYIGRLSEIEDPDLVKRIRKFYDGPEDAQLVIESLLGYGTVVRAMDDYQEDNLRVCRPTYLHKKDRQAVVCFAAEHLGLAYDIRQLLDLARFFFPYGILPKHWRSTLFQHNAGKPTHVVCSGMVARCFQSVHYPILPVIVTKDNERKKIYKRNFRLFVPADFDYSPYFDIVKFPEFKVSSRQSKPYLPWEDDIEEDADLPLTVAAKTTTLEGGSS
ncbi:hypothetical protein EOL70_27125 [Leucothrix sargassi]|nr:hypothetical protein EOL70_27125 [Leucothrix sargassi]